MGREDTYSLLNSWSLWCKCFKMSVSVCFIAAWSPIARTSAEYSSPFQLTQHSPLTTATGGWSNCLRVMIEIHLSHSNCSNRTSTLMDSFENSLPIRHLLAYFRAGRGQKTKYSGTDISVTRQGMPLFWQQVSCPDLLAVDWLSWPLDSRCVLLTFWQFVLNLLNSFPP